MRLHLKMVITNHLLGVPSHLGIEVSLGRLLLAETAKSLVSAGQWLLLPLLPLLLASRLRAPAVSSCRVLQMKFGRESDKQMSEGGSEGRLTVTLVSLSTGDYLSIYLSICTHIESTKYICMAYAYVRRCIDMHHTTYKYYALLIPTSNEQFFSMGCIQNEIENTR